MPRGLRGSRGVAVISILITDRVDLDSLSPYQVALRHFIEEVEDLEPIAAIIPNLLSNIFHLMNEVR